MKVKTKLNKTYNIIIQIIIIIVALGFVYKQIFYKKDLDKIIYSFEDLFKTNDFIIKFSLIILLMIVNWGIESLKWKFLIKKIENVSFLKSFKAVLTGVTVSTFTPNRIGDYFGRVFILKKANRWEAILITIIGSMSQLLITIIIGSIAILLFIPEHIDAFNFMNINLYYGLFAFVVIFNIFLLFLFFNVQSFTFLLNRLLKKNWRNFRKYIKVFSYYSTSELFKVLLYSFLRYCVFTLQFYLLLKLFSIPIPFFECIIIISLIFFTTSIIPTVALSELGIRNSAALYFISIYFNKFNALTDKINIGVFSATTTLWLINLALPALLGIVFVFNLKFYRK